MALCVALRHRQRFVVVAAAGGLYRRRGGKKMGPGPGAATWRQGRRGHAVKRGRADQQWRGSGAADGGRVTQKGHTRGRGGGGPVR
jgi:hypothetical protein